MKPLLSRAPLFTLVLLLAASAAAQDRPTPTSSESNPDIAGRWEPFGQIPVDQAGAGRRGYVAPGESAEITAPGTDQISFHTVAANDFYREQTNDFLITERSETHTAALGYRRGFKLRGFPRFELGGQIQVHESDNGLLNGFISGFESLWVSLTGHQSAKNQLRSGSDTLPSLGTFMTKDGQSIYQSPGNGSGFGDAYFVAQVLLRDARPSTGATRVAARVSVNVSGTSAFTEGSFVGIGMSVDKKLSGWAAFHGDMRTSLLADRVSLAGLPLKRATFAFSVGPELRLSRNSSLSLQIDGSTTPYLPTGAAAFDKNYGDVTLGVGRRFNAGRRHLVAQIYARENMDLPFSIRWNTDPDLSVGLKVTIR